MLDRLARALLSDPESRHHADVAEFALWCRRSVLVPQRQRYTDGRVHLGRGLVFHVAPANVPIMFAYTLALGLLAGNTNVVRLPSRPFPQVDHVCGTLRELLRRPEYGDLTPDIHCIRYDRSETEISRRLSELCDVRVIWGGDAAVRKIRRHPLEAGAFDVVFPDRYSVAVIESGAWLDCANKDRYVRAFFNDSYGSGQASCSAPRAVLWLGDRVAEARASLWGLLERTVAERHRPAAADAITKLEYSYTLIARVPGCRLCSTDVRVTRIWCEELVPGLLDGHPGGGLFLESGARNLDALLPLLQRRCQTVSYFGVPVGDLLALVRRSGPKGGHRIVPIGATQAFSLVWDGYDTIRTLSRTVGVTADPADASGAP